MKVTLYRYAKIGIFPENRARTALSLTPRRPHRPDGPLRHPLFRVFGSARTSPATAFGELPLAARPQVRVYRSGSRPANRERSCICARLFVLLAAPKILSLGKLQASELFLPSTFRIFDIRPRYSRSVNCKQACICPRLFVSLPCYVAERLPTARTDRFAAGAQKAPAGGVAPLLRRTAPLHHRRMLGQPGPSGLEPRSRGAGRSAALRLRHARRPHRVGRRPPDLRPQDHHGAPRGVPPQAPAGRHQRLPAHGRKPLRRLRRRPRLGLDLGGVRHGEGRRAAGRAAQGGGRHRRRFDDGRPRLRGAQQRRSLARHRPAGDPQRQQHGDRPSDGGAEELPAEAVDLETLQPLQAVAVADAPPCAPRAAPLPEGVERSEAGASEQLEPLREPRLPLFRADRRPQPPPSWCARCAHCARSKARSSSTS